MSNRRRGFAFLIHKSIQYSIVLQPAPTDQDNVIYVIMGDFNAHQSLWHCTLKNISKTNLTDQINESIFGILNED